MRIKEQFAKERISGQNEYRPKFFIASEGSTSEPKYFEGLNQSINYFRKYYYYKYFKRLCNLI